MRISDWSSDVCSSDLLGAIQDELVEVGRSCTHADYRNGSVIMLLWSGIARLVKQSGFRYVLGCASVSLRDDGATAAEVWRSASKLLASNPRSEEHTSELQSLMRISYAVFCLKKKK